MTTTPDQFATNCARFETAVQMDEAAVEQVARAASGGPGGRAGLVIPLLVSTLALLLLAVSVIGGRPVTANLVCPLAAMAVAPLLSLWWARRHLRTGLRTANPPGSVARAWFFDEGLVISGPTASAHIRYDRINELRPWGKAVGFRLVGQRQWRVYPGGLFPPHVLQFVAPRVGQRPPG